MKPISGLNRDVNPIDQPENTMRYAANGVISESTGLAESVRLELDWEDFGADFKFLGQSLGDTNIYVIGYNTSASQGEIWRYNPETPSNKELIIIDPSNFLELDLEAAADKVLQIVYQQDFEEHEVFAWAGQTKPKIIDVGLLIVDWLAAPLSLPANLDGNVGPPVVQTSSSLDFFLFPEGILFNPDVTALDSGGNVVTGAWFWVYRYVYPDGSSTKFSGVSNAVYITEDSFIKRQTFSGGEGSRISNKSIQIDFKYDTDHNPETIRIQFGFISIREEIIFAGILDAKGLSSMIINATDASYIYSGESAEIDLGDNILELISPKALYTNIQTLTSLTSRLYAANLTTKDEVNIQTIANEITSKWSMELGFWTNKGTLFNNNTFGAGEIYAIYISVLYTDGSESRGFHIPGRKQVPSDIDDLPTPFFRERWTIFDTVTKDAGSDGDTGYWVNTGEFYPSLSEFDSARDTGIYANNVRHHKMPSIGFFVREGLITDMARSPKLSIILDNIDLSSLGPEVIGYNIHYAKRKIGEFVNLVYECPTPVGQYPEGESARIAISGGFAYSDQPLLPNEVGDILIDVVPPTFVNMLKFHSLFLLDSFPSITPLYLVKELETLQAQTTGLVVDSTIYDNVLGTPVTLSGGYKYGFIDGTRSTPSARFATYDEEDRYVPIEDFAYVRNGVKWGFEDHTFDNRTGEDAFVIYTRYIGTGAFTGFNGHQIGTVPFQPFVSAVQGAFRFNDFATTVFTLCALRTVPTNVSSPFDAQTLNFAGSFVRDDGTSETAIVDGKHGDTFNSMMQFNATGVAGMGEDFLSSPAGGRTLIDTTTDANGQFLGEGSKMIYFSPCQSPINHAGQDIISADPQSYVAKIQGGIGTRSSPSTVSISFGIGEPKIKSWYFFDQNIYASMTYKYNSDFHRKSEYFTRGINDGYFVPDSRFPVTIGFSNQQGNSQRREWRNWLIGNRFTQPSEKGPIINLKGAGNQLLYIHHRYSMYITKDRLALKGGGTDVVLGSSDIFEVTPYEIVSVDEGHTGLKNRNWHTMSPFGYSWIQTDHGKVFTHNGKELDEISGKGMRVYFRDFLSDTDNRDEACYIINDDLRRRLIVGFGHQEDAADVGRTITYSTVGGFWSFFQDMNVVHPIVARDKRIFMWGKDTDLNKVFAVAEGGYDNTIKPFIIEVVMSDGSSVHKYLQYLIWNSNVFNAGVDEEFLTFNKLLIYSDTKVYGEPDGSGGWATNLFPYTGFPRGTQNLRRLEDNWSTNIFRDLWDGVTVIPDNTVSNLGVNPASVNETLTWDKKGRMRDKYFIIRLLQDEIVGKKFEFQNIEFGIKPSFR